MEERVYIILENYTKEKLSIQSGLWEQMSGAYVWLEIAVS